MHILYGHFPFVSSLHNTICVTVVCVAVCGEVDLLDTLIDAGADPSTPDIHGAYPLHYAAQVRPTICMMHNLAYSRTSHSSRTSHLLHYTTHFGQRHDRL